MGGAGVCGMRCVLTANKILIEILLAILEMTYDTTLYIYTTYNRETAAMKPLV